MRLSGRVGATEFKRRSCTCEKGDSDLISHNQPRHEFGYVGSNDVLHTSNWVLINLSTHRPTLDIQKTNRIKRAVLIALHEYMMNDKECYDD